MNKKKEKKEIVYDDNKHPQYWPKDVWLNSQLSIARFSGGLRFNNVPYHIEPLTGDLCRPDVYDARLKAYTEADKATIREMYAADR